MVLSLVIFGSESYLEFETIAFSVLILTEYFMTFSEVTKLHLFLLVFVGASLVCYVACLVFLREYIHLSQLTFVQGMLIVAIFAASWGPLFLWRYI